MLQTEKTEALRERNKASMREAVLDAAERLLSASSDLGDFSMRTLAEEAQVSFATPFNHFGSKNAIMQALSSRYIERMAERFRALEGPQDTLDRVLTMGHIGTGVLLESPPVSKAVVASIGLPQLGTSDVISQSTALWLLALGNNTAADIDLKMMSLVRLAEQLAYLFRGCLSFWIAGELSDGELNKAFARGVMVTLLGVSKTAHKRIVLEAFRSIA